MQQWSNSNMAFEGMARFSPNINTFGKQIPLEWKLPWEVENPLIKSHLKSYALNLFSRVSDQWVTCHLSLNLRQSWLVDQLSDHMNEVWPLPSSQSAYIPFHSTETAFPKAQSDILLKMVDQKVTLLVMLDISSAWDMTDNISDIIDQHPIGNLRFWL